MTIPEAIERLKKHRGVKPYTPDPDLRHALDLSIEALTYISKQRSIPPTLYIPLLPGETEE